MLCLHLIKMEMNAKGMVVLIIGILQKCSVVLFEGAVQFLEARQHKSSEYGKLDSGEFLTSHKHTNFQV